MREDPRSKPERDAEAFYLRSKGLSLSQIARQLNISNSRVTEVLVRHKARFEARNRFAQAKHSVCLYNLRAIALAFHCLNKDSLKMPFEREIL